MSSLFYLLKFRIIKKGEFLIHGVMDKKNGILEMFRSSGQKEWCLFLAVSSNFIQTYCFCFVK